MEIYRGDMFYVRNFVRVNGSEQTAERPALIVSNNAGNTHSDMCEIVYLTTKEKKPLPTHVEVMCKIPSTALCEQVFSVSQERLGEYIRTATETEMKKIDKALMISLGLNPDVTCNEDDELVNDLKKKIDIVETNNDILQMKLEGAERKLDEAHAKLEDKDRNLEELRKHNGLMQERIHEMESQPVFAPDPEEVVKLKAQVEMLERQNERLIDRLIG